MSSKLESVAVFKNWLIEHNDTVKDYSVVLSVILLSVVLFNECEGFECRLQGNIFVLDLEREGCRNEAGWRGT